MASIGFGETSGRTIHEQAKPVSFLVLSLVFVIIHCWPTGIASLGTSHSDYKFGFPLVAGSCGCGSFFWICGYVRIPELLFNLLFGLLAIVAATECFASLCFGGMKKLTIRQVIQASTAFCLTLSIFMNIRFNGIVFTRVAAENLDVLEYCRLPVSLGYLASGFVFFAAYFLVESHCEISSVERSARAKTSNKRFESQRWRGLLKSSLWFINVCLLL